MYNIGVERIDEIDLIHEVGLHRNTPNGPLGKGSYTKTEVRGYLAKKGKGKAKEALNQTVIYVTEVKGILR